MAKTTKDAEKLIGQLCSDTADMSKKSTALDLKKIDMMSEVLSKMKSKGLGVDNVIDSLVRYKELAEETSDLKHMDNFFKLWLKLIEVKADVGLKSIVTNLTQINNLESMGHNILEEPVESNEDFLLSEIKNLKGNRDESIRRVEIINS